MITKRDIRAVLLALKDKQLPEQELEEFLWGHVSQCILSAVYSLGTTSSLERRVVHDYAQWARLSPMCRSRRDVQLARNQQQDLEAFVEHIEVVGAATFAKEVIHNMRPTDAADGRILRAEACLQFAKVGLSHGVHYMDDVKAVINSASFTKAVKSIRGQRPGTSLDYFCMLVSDDNRVKLDTHVRNFLTQVCKRQLSDQDMRDLIAGAAQQRGVTQRKLDNLIWVRGSSRQP